MKTTTKTDKFWSESSFEPVGQVSYERPIKYITFYKILLDQHINKKTVYFYFLHKCA